MINKAYIHPLFLLSVTDQIYRKNELNDENGNPVQGLILGASSDYDNENENENENKNKKEKEKGNEQGNEQGNASGNARGNGNTTPYQSVSLLISFELPYTSTPQQVDTKIELLKTIYGNLKVIGFYQILPNDENTPQRLAELIHSWDLQNPYLSSDLVIVQIDPNIESTKSLETNIQIFRLQDLTEIEDKEIRTISSENLGLQSYNKAVANIENFENFGGNNNDDQLQHAKEQEEIEEGLIDLHCKLCELVDFCHRVISGSIDVYGDVHVYESIKVIVKLVDTMKRVKSIATIRANETCNNIFDDDDDDDDDGNNNTNNNNKNNIIDKISALAICCLSFNEENVLGKSVQLRSNE